MPYVLATTETIVRWYEFDILEIAVGAPNFKLADRLDLNAVAQFGEEGSAVAAAYVLGLTTWRCVKI